MYIDVGRKLDSAAFSRCRESASNPMPKLADETLLHLASLPNIVPRTIVMALRTSGP